MADKNGIKDGTKMNAVKKFGIDVSLYQKNMDFRRAAEQGVTFAVVKATEAMFTDPEFENNFARAKAAGLNVGAYHYLKAASAAEAKRCAEYMIEHALRGKVFEYPIFVDVEDSTLKKLPKEELTQLVRTFCDALEKAGYWAGFYTNLDWYRNFLDGSSLAKRYSFWFAYWGTECPLDDCQMWQFGGSINRIRSNMIAGVVCDQDYCMVDYPEMIEAKGLNGMKRPPSPAHKTEPPVSATPADRLKVIAIGDRVRIKQGAPVYGSNEKFAPWVYGTTLFVREVSGDRVVVSTKTSGPVTGAVDRKYLIKR